MVDAARRSLDRISSASAGRSVMRCAETVGYNGDAGPDWYGRRAMSEALETTDPTDSPVRSTTSVLLLLAALVAVPLLLLLLLLTLRGAGSDGAGANFVDTIVDDRIQAVYLASDEVFFGSITDAEGEVLVLQDAFFLRRTKASGDDKDAADGLDLVSVAQDVGGDGNLLINAREVVRIQNLAADAEIAQSIEDATK